MSDQNEGPPEEEAPKAKLVFKFTKKIESKVVQRGGPDSTNDVVQLEADEVTHIENGLINGLTKPKKKEPVIARTTKANDWRIERLQKTVDEGTATDEQKALLALLREGLEQPLMKTEEDDSTQLENFEGEADDVEPDYEKISYTDFGAAFLRGRGWKKEEGIGRTNKRVVPLTVNAKGKTFDMGLKKKKKEGEAAEEAIPLGVGVAVKVLYGKCEGKYGKVVSVDSASGRCDVKLQDGTVHEIMDKLLHTVTDSEYTENTRVINKSEVDKYKKQEEAKVKKEEKRSRNGGESLSKSIERRLSISKEDDDEVQFIGSAAPSSSTPWPSPDLLVRVITKKYKDGRYYKEKMIVVDAMRRSHIELRDDRGKNHVLDQRDLETVIPRGTGGQVRILNGPKKNKYGVVVERDDKRYILKVRVVGSNDVINVDFDDACEYRGNLEEMDFD